MVCCVNMKKHFPFYLLNVFKIDGNISIDAVTVFVRSSNRLIKNNEELEGQSLEEMM